MYLEREVYAHAASISVLLTFPFLVSTGDWSLLLIFTSQKSTFSLVFVIFLIAVFCGHEFSCE